MQTYTTQMDAARKGIITPQMEIVAKKEYRTTEEIRQWVAEGKVAIPANKHHECLNPEGVGSMLRTKINVNLGVSRDCKDYNVEMQKVMSAVNMGAEAIMDLSSHGNTQPFRQKLTHECPVMIGVSVHSVEEAQEAVKHGADCLGVGAAFATHTKTDVDVLPHETLKAICDAVDIPVVAIGGIHKENILQLKGTGVDGVALVSAIFAADDIETECRELKALSEQII